MTHLRGRPTPLRSQPSSMSGTANDAHICTAAHRLASSAAQHAGRHDQVGEGPNRIPGLEIEGIGTLSQA